MPKRTAYQIGYVAGLMERRGALSEIYDRNHGLELQFRNEAQARYIAKLMGGRIVYHPKGERFGKVFVYLTVPATVGWIMTIYQLMCPPMQERFKRLIIFWQATRKRYRRPASCHKDRPHHARGKCAMCYKRFVNNIPMTAWKRLD